MSQVKMGLKALIELENAVSFNDTAIEQFGDAHAIAQDGPLSFFDNEREIEEGRTNKEFSIINLTQHTLTDAQLRFCEEVQLDDDDKAVVKDLLNFKTAPSADMIFGKALGLAEIVECKCIEESLNKDKLIVLIGGAPYLMGALESQLKRMNLQPAYSFSKRVSEEKALPDGTVEKINKFVHESYILV